MKQALRVGGVPEHFNLPWQLALKDGAFAKAGVPIEYSEFPEGTGAMNRALDADSLDMAMVLTEGGVADVVNQGVNRLVKIFVTSPLIWGIHVGRQSEIKKIGQIQGARYAISRYGSGSHLMAVVDAALRGWLTDAMKFVVVGTIDGANDALTRNKADVFFWERFITQPLVDQRVFRRIGQRVAPWPAFAVSASHDVLRARSKDVFAVLDVSEKYAKRLQRRKSTVQLVADTYGLKRRDAQAWFDQVRWGGGYRRPNTALSRIVESLARVGVIDSGKVSLDEVWHDLSGILGRK